MILRERILNPDILGATASTMCLVHCIATPFIFIAQACTAACCSEAPVWWKAVDFVFLVISFAAIHYSTKNNPKRWLKSAMYISWVLLLIAVIMKSFGIGHLPELLGYIPAAAIIGLHIYNLRTNRCQDHGGECAHGQST